MHIMPNIKGIHRLQLSPMFNTEMTESIEHADIVRKIVQLGGIPVTERSHTKLLTQLIMEMLNQALETEIKASEVYAELLPLIEQTDDLYDSIEQIYLSELKSVEEMVTVSGLI